MKSGSSRSCLGLSRVGHQPVQDSAIMAAGHKQVLVPRVPRCACHVRLVPTERCKLAHHPCVKHLRCSLVIAACDIPDARGTVPACESSLHWTPARIRLSYLVLWRHLNI